jgi:hypothetical protein
VGEAPTEACAGALVSTLRTAQEAIVYLSIACFSCAVAPCAWQEVAWERPPLEELTQAPCVGIMAARGTGLSFGPLPGCPELGRCFSVHPYQVAEARLWVDTSLDGWESRPAPLVLEESLRCELHTCAEMREVLLAGQRDDEAPTRETPGPTGGTSAGSDESGVRGDR